MVPNPALTTGIVNSMSYLWKNETLADFTVEIEKTSFQCHRFILGACSKFFYAMFTSDMKETKDNSARLHGIDSSSFELILRVFYTGENVVNEENVLSIWQFAHLLQIPFLVEHCEKFSISILSMANYAEFSRVAKLLDSIPVLEGIKRFMLKYFMEVKDDELFLELTADELIELLQNDALEVTSEDDVLFAILKWIEGSSDQSSGVKNDQKINNFNSGIDKISNNTLIGDEVKPTHFELPSETQNNGTFSEKDPREMYKPQQNRAVHLESLLKASRSCLASPRCLHTLYKHFFTQSDEGALTVIFDAMLYQVKGYRHEYFPSAALHRNSSEYEHAGVIAYDSGSFQALSLPRNKWYPMPTCKEIKNRIKIALFDSCIYAVGQAEDSTSKLCVLKESSWTIIHELPGLKYFLLSNDAFLYVFNSSNGEIHRMQPNSYEKSLRILEHPDDFAHLEFALSLKEYILAFSSDSQGGKEETAVYVMNTQNEKWHQLENLDGPAKNMASFQDGDEVYLLQNNGNLWHLSTDKANTVTIKFIQKLWDEKESLRGALLHKGKLCIYLKLPIANPYSKILPSVPGVFQYVQPWARHGYASNFICIVMHTQDMIES